MPETVAPPEPVVSVVAKESPAATAVSIVIPAYNESSCVASTVKALHERLIRVESEFEIVVVDDGSTDETREVVGNLCSVLKGVRLVCQPENKGKGAAVRRGMMEACGDVRIFMDADLPYDLAALDRTLELFDEGGADIVLGARDHQDSSAEVGYGLMRRLSSGVFSSLVSMLAVKGIKDTQCGFKAFTREAAEAIYPRTTIDGFGFDPEVLHIAQKLRFRIQRIPVVLRHRKDSKVQVVRDAIRMTRDLLRIRLNSLLGRYNMRPPEDGQVR